MNYTQLNKFDTMNGDGIRVSLFVAGCTLNCKGCFNKEAQNFKSGHLYDDTVELNIMKLLDNEYIDGISILGGDPLMPQNYPTVLNLVTKIKQSYPEKTIWLWTGRTLNEAMEQYSEIFDYIDVVIDGPFVQELYDSELRYRGSKNQRILRKEIDF
jgi:anaerobic ribonucleoside-triphosphate reductase activating protein